MTAESLLASLPEFAFQAALLMARLGAAAMLLPGTGEQDAPATIRLGLALALVALLLPVLRPVLPAPPDDAARAVAMVVVEVLVGLWIGGLARLIVLGFVMAGQMVALLTGLASALVPDPLGGQQATAPSRAFTLLAAVVVLSSGLHAVPLGALAQSYEVLPAGGTWPSGAAADSMAVAAAGSLELALRLAAPFVLGAVVLNLSLGLLARLAPQVQVYFVAMPGQVLAGLVLLAVLLGPMLRQFGDAAARLFAALPGAS